MWRNLSNATATATQIGITATNQYADYAAADSVRYFYWVKATNTAGTSGFSQPDGGFRQIPCGVLSILSGTLGGQSFSNSQAAISVPAGSAITGSVNVRVVNFMPGSAIAPLCATPTWGNPQSVYWGINSWVPTGSSDHNSAVNLTAPTNLGTYYIAFAMAGTYNYAQITSGTHPGWSADWVNGDKVALLPAGDFETARSEGWIRKLWYMPGSGWATGSLALAAVRVHVVENDAWLTNGLLAYYPFNGNANDESGNGRHGTVSAAAIAADRRGQPASAYFFDGTNSQVTVPSMPLAGTSFSFVVWCRRSDGPSGTNDNLFALSHASWGGQDTGFHVGYRGGSLAGRFTFSFYADDLDTSPAYADTEGGWHCWVGTYDNATRGRRLYRDGVLVTADTAGGPYQGAGAFFVGSGWGPSTPWWFHGWLDDVRLYTRVLSSNEALRLADSGQAVVNNGAGPTNLTVNSATLRGSLILAGGGPTRVCILWGRSDGGTIISGWTNVCDFGVRSVGPFSTNVTGLSSNTVYYYRCWASNAYGVAWAPSSTSFLTDGDSDGDGMLDSWERQHFGDLTRDGTGDFDGDGATDRQEYGDLTNPADAGSVRGAVAHWPLNEGSGSLANDASGNGRTGTVSGATWTNAVPPLNGGPSALAFGGADAVAVADTNMFGGVTSVTFSAWFNASEWPTGTNRLTIFRRGTGTDDGGLELALTARGVVAGVRTWLTPAAGAFTVASGVPTPGTWHHLAGVYDGQRLSAYLDGVKVAETNLPASAAVYKVAGNTYIGRRRASDTWGSFKGVIDDVRVYDYARTAAGIARDAGLLACWRFEESAGSDTSDWSGNGHTGRLYNAAWTNAAAPVDGGSRALDFGGTAYVEAPDGGTLSGISNLTVSCWFRADNFEPYAGQACTLVSKDYQGDGTQTNDSCALTLKRVTNDLVQVQAEVWSGAATYAIASAQCVLKTGVWYQAAMSLGGGSLRVFLDGRELTRAACSAVPNANPSVPVRVGQCSGPATRYFDGVIDEVRIWGYARSSEELRGDVGGRVPTGYTWRRIVTPLTVRDPGLAIWGGKLYLAGGMADNNPSWEQCNDRVWQFDPGTERWALLGGRLPYPMGPAHTVPVVVGGTLVSGPEFGPTVNGGWGQHKKIVEFDLAQPSLDGIETAAYPVGGNIWCTLVAKTADGRVYSLGGWTGSGHSAVCAYDPVADALSGTGVTLSRSGTPHGYAVDAAGLLHVLDTQSGRNVDVFDMTAGAETRVATVSNAVPEPLSGCPLVAWSPAQTRRTYVCATASDTTIYEYNAVRRSFSPTAMSLPARAPGYDHRRFGVYDLDADRLYTIEAAWNGTNYDTCLLIGAPTYSEDGLVAWYPFDGDARDASGNGNDGTVNRASVVADRYGNTDAAYQFDGTSAYVEVPDAPELRLASGSFSLSAWVKWNQSGNLDMIIAKRAGGSRRGWFWGLAGWSKVQELSFSSPVNGDPTAYSIFALSHGEWRFLVATYESAASNVTFFVDGSLDSMIGGMAAPVSDTRVLRIGRDSSSEFFFPGSIDDVRIYNRALSSNEVWRQFNEAGGGTVQFTVAGSPGEHGAPLPEGYSTRRVKPGTVITNSVPTPADETGGVRWACAGWTGSGSVPGSGSTNAVTVAVTNDSTLTWQWRAEYWLTAGVSGSGSVGVTGGGVEGGWWKEGSNATLTATAGTDWVFSHWEGAVTRGSERPGNGPELDAGDEFGVDVTSIGDLDGDGVDDVAVGVLCDDDGATNAGAVYVLFMNRNGTVKCHQKISETAGNGPDLDVNDNFGRSVSDMGDIDGDGVQDFAVGAYFDDDGESDAGAVYVLFMNRNGTVKGHQKISETNGNGPDLEASDRFGVSVANIGDLDADGVRDLAVGAYLDDDGQTDAGAVYVLFMNTNGTVKGHQKISEISGNGPDLDGLDAFGVSVAAIGDLDADGVRDIAVGAYLDDDGSSDAGSVYILFLTTNGMVKSHQKISEISGNGPDLEASDRFGVSVADIGDLDADGVRDLAVGAHRDDDGQTDAGAVYVLFMNTNGTVNGHQKISETSGNGPHLDGLDGFGVSVAGIGDLDADGARDLAVGAFLDDDGGIDAGAVYTLFLSSNGTVKAIQKICETNNPLTLVMDRARAVTAVFERVTVPLTVNGSPAQHGTPAPYGYGVSAILPGTVITNTIVSPADESGGVRYACAGWTGSGSIPPEGGTPNCVATITNASVLTWVWRTEWRGEWSVSGVGCGSVDQQSAWYTNGARVTLAATASNGWHFAGWSGDVPGTDIRRNPVTLTMNQARSVTASFVSNTVSAGLAAFYPFNGNAQDESGNGYHPSETNAALAADRYGATNSAYAFDGSNDLIRLPKVGLFDLPAAESRTVAFWVRPVGSGAMVSRYLETAGLDARWAVNWVGTSACLRVELQDGTPGDEFHATPAGSFQSNTWRHAAVTVDRSAQAIRVYADGVLVLSEAIGKTGSIVNTQWPMIGAADHALTNGAAGQFYSGRVDDVRVYDWALGSNDVWQVYQLGGVLRRFTVAGSPAPHDSPTPQGYGTHFVADGTTVTNTVTTPCDESGGVRWACAGWTGSGSVPPEGGTPNCAFTITNNSDLTWQWRPEWWLDTGVSGSGSVDVADAWWTNGAAATVRATASNGWQFAGWTGDVPGGSGTNNPLVVTMDRPRAVTAQFVRADIKLVVAGSPARHGTSAPYGYGTNLCVGGTLVTNTVNSPADESSGVRWACSGWTGTGSVPASGSTNRVAVTITNDSTLTWNWTPQYRLSASADGSGNVNVPVGWYTPGSAVSVTAAPDTGYALSYWSGDVPPGMARNGNGPALRSGDRFATGLGRLGDLNGDGHSDIALGSPFDDAKHQDAGASYVVFMRPDGTADRHQKISETNGNGPNLDIYNRFGSALDGVGDLNGDGTPDLVAGASGDSALAGAVYVLFLSSNGVVASAPVEWDAGDLWSLGITSGDRLGDSVAWIGDLGGDGTAEVAVGAPGTDDGAADAGRVYVFSFYPDGDIAGCEGIGNSNGLGLALDAGDAFGAAACRVGDVDDDGVADLVVGAPGDDDGSPDAGAVYVLFMQANSQVKSFMKISALSGGGPALDAGDAFGSAAAALGDLDGDGVEDIWVGARGDDDGAADAGAGYVLFLGTNGAARSVRKTSVTAGGCPLLAGGDAFGSSAAGLGDLDGDGVADLAVGAPGDDTEGADAGTAYVLFMQTNGLAKGLQKLGRSNNPLKLTMDGPKSLTAHFSKPGGIGYAPASLSPVGWDTWNPPNDTITVWNAQSTLPMTFTVTRSNTWVSVNPAGGVSRGEAVPITVSYTTIGLATGVHQTVLTIRSPEATNGVQSVHVTLTVLPTPAHYVDAASVTPRVPYLTWATAARTIQEAVDAASAGDTVLVTNGTYAAGGRAVYVGMTNRVAIDKAVAVRSVNGPAQTLIAGKGPVGDGAVRCAWLTNGAVLAGFTLSNGCTRVSADYRDGSGGGVWCRSEGATVSNCVFVRNTAHKDGGGAYSGTLLDCVLRDNEAGSQGGGTYRSVVRRSSLLGNLAHDGGGSYYGTLSECVVRGNAAENEGGGVRSAALYSSLLVTNAADHGGGAFDATLFNCTVVENDAAYTGGGVSGSALRNCIVQHNTAGVDANWHGGKLTYSCTTPKPELYMEGVTNNITADPQFVDRAAGDYRLRALSPCVDAGVNQDWMFAAQALGGGPRVRNGTVDMGAYEFAFRADLRAFLQGAYSTNVHAMVRAAGTNAIPRTSPYAVDARTVAGAPTNAVDWMLVELRARTNEQPVAARSVFLGTDGRVLDDGGAAGALLEAGPSNYWVAVKHRNHLAAMSAGAVAFTNLTVAYDFTLSSNRYFGGAAAAVAVETNVWALRAGDADGDGEVLPVDAAIHGTQNGMAGYHRADFNLDGAVDAADANAATANLARASAIPHPETTLAPALAVTPSRRTVLEGESFAFFASGTSHWAFVRSGAAGMLNPAQGTSTVYTAGTGTSGVDVVEAWTRDDLLGRAAVNVIREADVTKAGKAVIIGGRKGAGDPLWPTTKYLTDFCYDTLMYRGFSPTNVQYLSPVVAGGADLTNSLANVRHTFTNWIGGASRLCVFLCDHGGDRGGQGYFRLNENEELSAAVLDGWLDAWQTRTSNDVVVVIDSCFAGSLADELGYGGPGSRIVIAACGDDEPTYFVAGGLVSFSQSFLNSVLAALDVAGCFQVARDDMAWYQTAVISGNGPNGNGQGVYIGESSIVGRDRPWVGRVVGAQVLAGETAATLWADEIASFYPVKRVWAVIVPPDYNPNPTNPVSNLTEVELTRQEGSGRYQAAHAGFGAQGLYQVMIYARDEWNSVSLPRRTTVLQTVFDEKVIVVAGDGTNEGWRAAISALADDTYRNLLSRWFDDGSIQYLTPHLSPYPKDGSPTVSNLAWAVTNWSAASDRLTVILIGQGATNGLTLAGGSEVLKAEQLDGLLDGYQASNREAYVVMEFAHSTNWLPRLTPPEGQRRICIASTPKLLPRQAPDPWPNRGADSFLYKFMKWVCQGRTIGDAYIQAEKTLPNGAKFTAVALLDDSGDGVAGTIPNQDGALALTRYIGTPVLTGAEAPMIAQATPDTLLVGSNAVTLWASGITHMEPLSNVWCMVMPPDYDGSGDLPEVSLAWNVENARYEAGYAGFTAGGVYLCTFYVEDAAGGVSTPMQCRIMRPDPYETDDGERQAVGFLLGEAQRHNFHCQGDEDWVRVFLSSNYEFEIRTEHLGENVDTAITLYRLMPDGTLSEEAFKNRYWKGLAYGEAIRVTSPDSGVYYIRVSSGDLSCWGLDTEYDLVIWVPIGADGSLWVAALDVVDGARPPAGAYAVVDGESKYFVGVPQVIYTGLSQGQHLARVVVQAGYWPAEDPFVVGAVGDPGERGLFGNPRLAAVPPASPAGCGFVFYPMARVQAVVKDGLTGGRIGGARLAVAARSGRIAGLTYTNYQNTAWGGVWQTDGDGTLPNDQGAEGILAPAAWGDLTLTKAGYAPLVVSNAIPAGAAAGFQTNLQTLWLRPVDANSNGVADAWEVTHFPGGMPGGGTNDTDRDGSPDGDEYGAGTDPTNAASVLGFEGPSSNGPAGFTVQWDSVPWRTYRVRGTNDLMGGSVWPVLSPEMEATQSQYRMSWLDASATGKVQRFYRVDAVLP